MFGKKSSVVPWVVLAGIVIVVAVVFALPTGQNTAVSAGLFRISVLAAFFGGVLSFLSPCSAALMPAFFAYSFKEKTQLLKMTFVFWLGLATLFVPLGFSASLLSRLFITHQLLFFYIAGAIFILLGLLSLSGKTLSFGMKSVRYDQNRPVGTVYLMGVLFAFASGTCAAPIIGGIFTLAATQGQAATAIGMLLIYSLGLVAPLAVIAWFFDRYNFAQSKLMQGREYRIGTWEIHSTKLITGIIFIAIGVIFIVTRGTNGLLRSFGAAGLTDFYYQANEWLLLNTRDIPSAPVMGVIVVIIIALFMRKKRHNKREFTLDKTAK